MGAFQGSIPAFSESCLALGFLLELLKHTHSQWEHSGSVPQPLGQGPWKPHFLHEAPKGSSEHSEPPKKTFSEGGGDTGILFTDLSP